MEFRKNPLGEKEQRAKYKLSFIYHFFLITSIREYKEVKQFPNTLAKIIRRAIINKTITCRFLKNIQIKNNSFNECMEGITLFLTRNNSSFLVLETQSTDTIMRIASSENEAEIAQRQIRGSSHFFHP